MMLPRRPLHALVDCLVIFVVLACATIAFQPSFGGIQYLFTGLGAALLGIIVGVVTSLRPLRGWLQTLAGVIIAFTLFGPALAVRNNTIGGVIPTLESWRELYLGVVFSWRRLLTAQPPAEGFPGPLIVPFIIMLVLGAIATVLAMRLRRGAPWAMLPAGAALILSIAFGTKQEHWPIALGIGVAAVGVLWMSWRLGQWRRSLADDVEITSDTRARVSVRKRRAIGGVAMVAGAAVIGSLVMLPIQPTNRHVIRDVVEPPVEIEEYPSPLVGYRGWIKNFEDDTLVVATGLEGSARLPIAVLDYYDGTVYAVAGSQPGATSGQFTRVGDRIETQQSGTPMTVNVEIDNYSGVWVPTTGYAQSITFAGPRSQQLQSSLSYNGQSGTAIVVAGLQQGDSYEVQAIVPAVPDPDELEGVAISDIQMPAPAETPELLEAWVTTYGLNQDSDLDSILTLQQLMRGGAFSHGLEGDPRSLAGHGVWRMNEMFRADTTVGDDEQYAVAFSLAMAQLGIPARVVMGFNREDGFGNGEAVELKGGDLHAWVEIPFEGYGWVPFDVSPPEDNTNVEPPPVPEPNPRPQVLQPPQPPEEPAELTPGSQPEEGQEDDEDTSDNPWPLILGIAGSILALLALIALPFIVVGLLKSRRRKRRFTEQDQAARLSGGWSEVVDQAVDLGLPVPVGVTRQEVASVVHAQYPEAQTDGISQYVDAGVFGPEPPPEPEVTAFWGDIDVAVKRMRKQANWRKKLASRLSLRSFIRRRKGRT